MLNDKQIDKLLENIFKIECKIPIEVKHNLSDFALRLKTLKNLQQNGKSKQIQNIDENICYIAYSEPIIEPDGKIFLCHINSKLWRIKNQSPRYFVDRITKNKRFSDIWSEFKDKPIYHCNNSNFCNPRDILLNQIAGSVVKNPDIDLLK